MPFVENHGVKIYFEAYGQGHPIVFLHGFTRNIQLWKLAGYVSGLEKSYRVILIDQRGHGQSDKPHDAEAYRLENRLGDVIAVLDHLGVTRASLFGYSMGGWLAFSAAAYFPERVASLVIGGAHPFQESFNGFIGVDGSDPDAFIQALSSLIGEQIAPEFHPLILQNDLVALSAAAQDRQSIEERLSGIAAPCLLFVGDSDKRFDKIKLCATKLPNARVLVVPSTGHVTALLKVDIVLPAVVRFLAENPAGIH